MVTLLNFSQSIDTINYYAILITRNNIASMVEDLPSCGPQQRALAPRPLRMLVSVFDITNVDILAMKHLFT